MKGSLKGRKMATVADLRENDDLETMAEGLILPKLKVIYLLRNEHIQL